VFFVLVSLEDEIIEIFDVDENDASSVFEKIKAAKRRNR